MCVADYSVMTWIVSTGCRILSVPQKCATEGYHNGRIGLRWPGTLELSRNSTARRDQKIPVLPSVQELFYQESGMSSGDPLCCCRSVRDPAGHFRGSAGFYVFWNATLPEVIRCKVTRLSLKCNAEPVSPGPRRRAVVMVRRRRVSLSQARHGTVAFSISRCSTG